MLNSHHRCDMFKLLYTSYIEEFRLAVIHLEHVGNFLAPQFCHKILAAVAESVYFVEGIALHNRYTWWSSSKPWEMLFWQIGNIDVEQHRGKLDPWYSCG